MSACVAQIWRYPVKAHGRERLYHVQITQGKCIAWDRRWAVLHEAARFNDARPEWVPCNNFSRACKAPLLQAISASSDVTRNRVTFRHPRLDDLTVDPDNERDAATFIQWVLPISPNDRALPERLVRAPGRGMTDTDFASVSLINLASHREVSRRLGRTISHLRWRGNIILDGLAPWAENGWIGRRLKMGTAELEIVHPITRCMATAASPSTGIRDADLLGTLQSGWGHQNMGVYARVTASGELRQGDGIESL